LLGDKANENSSAGKTKSKRKANEAYVINDQLYLFRIGSLDIPKDIESKVMKNSTKQEEVVKAVFSNKNIKRVEDEEMPFLKDNEKKKNNENLNLNKEKINGDKNSKGKSIDKGQISKSKENLNQKNKENNIVKENNEKS